MHAFIVEGENKVGELARLTETLAKQGVNITAISASACGGSGSVALCTNNDDKARAGLRESKFSYREVEAVECGLEDKPGTLATACRRLADAGVNIESLMPTGMSGSRIKVAFVTSDPTSAKKALAEFIGVHA